MPDEEGASPPADAQISPETVAARTFHTAFRGFDPVEVRAFLVLVAEELRRASEGVDNEERRQAEEASRAVVAAATEEAAEILRTAREQAVTTEAAASEEATRVVADAREQAERLVQEAGAALAGRTEEAATVADRIRADADEQAAAARARAREEADAIIAGARQRGREMIEEAQEVRARMLADLTRRRRAAQAQIEQMRAGRDRMLEALRASRRMIDELTIRLEVADPAPVSPRTPRPPERGEHAGRTPTVPGRRGAAAQDDNAGRPRAGAAQARAATAGDEEGGAPTDAPSEERRSSALRILRRNRSRPESAPSDLTVVQTPDADESVRVIRPVEQPPRDEAEPVERNEAAGESVDHEPGAADQPEREETARGAADVGRETPAAPAAPAAPDTPDASDTPGRPPLEPADPRPPSPVAADVDRLFARLRADRAATRPAAEEAAAAAGSASPAAEAAVETESARIAPETEETRRGDLEESLLQRRDALVEPIEVQLVRKLKRLLQDEQNELLDRLRTHRGTDHGVLPAPSEHQVRYRDAGAGLLEEAARAGAGTAPFGPGPVSVDDLASQLAVDLAGPLHSRLQRVMSEARADGLDVGALSERISAVYREWKAQKAAGIGAHYVTAAYARGFFLATPEGTPLRWVVDDDGPCPDCDDNALAGPTPRGQVFPTGQLHPPAHFGCRCLLSPAPA